MLPIIALVAGVGLANKILAKSVIPRMKGRKGGYAPVDCGMFGTVAMTKAEAVGLASQLAPGRQMHESLSGGKS